MKNEQIFLISLGCPKNLVDSEVMLGLLVEKGYVITTVPSQAEIILINTCSFIKDATRETLDAIHEAVDLKRSGSCRLLIVTGCLPQRYGQDLAREIPEVDFFLGTEEFHGIAQYLEKPADPKERVAIRRTSFLYDHQTPRLLSGHSSSAYIKIAEGCSRSCSFCVIPSLRGRFRSRPMDSIVQEASLLVDQGVREINLVAQETTSYGLDLQDRTTLKRLLERLCLIEDLRWIRVLYAYPEHIDRGLLRLMGSSEKICNYIDLPIQHIDEKILRSMGRPVSRKFLEGLIGQIRGEIPDVAIRTTLMVGFPGERAAQFSELVDFVEATRFERLGVFEFSPEEGTEAARMGEHVPAPVKKRRRERLMALQQRISLDYNRKLIGKTIVALTEGPRGHDGMLTARMETQAPEVDGQIIITKGRAAPGQVVDVRITRAHPYDLEGEMV
ncbi:MAG: 30S ribosomal protein S12 methylthiotransferase RimO [Proteobacteria bacterium]|nr:30S ribosomal protein S12 methylthiotransferase RimO [Pseudomonadota bacterium]